ncbi:PKD domain-containing protein [Methanofollis fontis]|uniref:PKD domain-containing protein n=1 Tax=Methanofollis fontis TaxID=2052832 RepID=A0A483CSZ5_9EURY|nr:PKD domain-containing protein [Methanofollis fontis]TAJ45464.1 hypothetical protein CUJ86_01660 [Methanofollis fontis]
MHRTTIPGVVLILLMLATAPAWAAPTDEIGYAAGAGPLTYAATAGTPGLNADDNITVIWSGTVEIDPEGTFALVPINTGTPIELDRITPIGALDAASEPGDFTYEVWEADWGILVESVNNITVQVTDNDETYIWWFHDTTDPYVTNNATFKSLADGERIELIYAPLRDTYEEIVAGTEYLIDMTVRFTNETKADFRAEPTNGTAPLTVQFTDLSTVENITAWAWDFGVENATSDEQNPTYTYEMPGVYTVSLTITDEANVTYTEVKADYINVTEPIGPGADFSADVTAGEAPLTVNFTDLSTVENITAWFWDFGNGFMSTMKDPLFTYHTPGVYNVSLTVTDDQDMKWTTTQEGFINVTAPFTPEADFSADVTNGTAPLTVNFTDLSTVENITAWAWDFGVENATSEEQNPTYIYEMPGTYTVGLTVTDDTGTTYVVTKPDYITVLEEEQKANFTANATAGTAPLAVQFTDQSTVAEITSWFWEFGDGSTSEEQNPVYVYTANGTYDVTLTINREQSTYYWHVKYNYIHVG